MSVNGTINCSEFYQFFMQTKVFTFDLFSLSPVRLTYLPLYKASLNFITV